MKYDKPDMEIVKLEAIDVIRTSDKPLNGWGGGEGNDNWTERP